MAADYQVGRDFTVSSAGAIWTDEGIARMLKSGDLQPLHTPPQVHRVVGEAALSAMSAVMPDVPVLTIPATIAATFREGQHYARVGRGHDWTAEGYAALRQAGWDGGVRTLPEVADVIGRVALAIPRTSAPAAIAPAVSTRPAPAPSTTLPTRPVPPAAAKPRGPDTGLDMKRIFARSHRGDASFAKMAGPATPEDDLAGAASMTELSSRFWTRHRARDAANLCPRTGKTRHTTIAPEVAARTDARAENRLPDAADVLARRRPARATS